MVGSEATDSSRMILDWGDQIRRTEGEPSMLERIESPADLQGLSPDALDELAAEIRQFLVEKVCRTGGHLGPNLGVVERTLALHRVFDVGTDVAVGHRASGLRAQDPDRASGRFRHPAPGGAVRLLPRAPRARWT